MFYAPATLLALRSYLKPPTGLDDDSLCIVGDSSTAAGISRSKDRLRANDYSNRDARDTAG